MTLREAYIYIYGVLEGYYENTRIVDLGDILTDMTLWSNLWKDESPLDPAYWGDWINAVRKVTDKDSLTDTEAVKAAIYFLKFYNDNHGFKLKKVISLLEKKFNSHVAAEKTRKINHPS
jgi:hypothetical protein